MLYKDDNLRKEKEMNGSAANKSSPNIDDSDVAKKRMERQERLRLWKLKQQEKSLPTFKPLSVGTISVQQSGSNRPAAPLKAGDIQGKKAPNGRKARPIFQQSPNPVPVKHVLPSLEDSLPISKKNNSSDIIKHEAVEDGDDPLDSFMAGLQSTDDCQQGNNSSADLILDSNDIADGLYLEDEDHSLTASNYLARIEKSKKKALPTVDHSTLSYEPFTKNLYTEVDEIANLTEMDVEDVRLDMDGIVVKGDSVPRPITKWEQSGLHLHILATIRSLGLEKPTPIQAQAIPCILSGRDVVGVAKTGSGKTLAFVLPMLRFIKDQRPLSAMEGPIGLIMSPTRELAMQIHRECRIYAKSLNLRATCAYGGAPIKDQIAELKRGTEILVCTPGRLIDLLTANGGRVLNLERVTYVVLDEADRMFDMGFEPQVMKIIGNIRPDRQTILFSATFPKHMERLAKSVLSNPIEIIVGQRSVVAPEVTQNVIVIPETRKLHKLLDILGGFFMQDEKGRAIIFVERQEAADELLKQVIQNGYECLAIHGGKDQLDRDAAIRDFRNGKTSLLIATSVAARGLDVKELRLVVNYDAPNHLEDYVHRVGRTGRAGNEGTAWTFISPDQTRAAYDISKALRLSKKPIPTEVRSLSDVHWKNIKRGHEKESSGFGGKGLDRLDEERDFTRSQEKRAFRELEEDGEVSDDDNKDRPDKLARPAMQPSRSPAPSEKIDNTMHSYTVDPPSISKSRERGLNKFTAKLVINDFPQEARQVAVQGVTLKRVASESKASIYVRGQYHPHGAKIDAPKLFILIEGETDGQVRTAYYALANVLVQVTNSTKEPQAQAGSNRYTVV